MDQPRRRLRAALEGEAPGDELHRVVLAFRAEGMDQRTMYRLLTEHLVRMPADDPRLDDLLDVMDLVWGGGWGRGGDLFPDALVPDGAREVFVAGECPVCVASLPFLVCASTGAIFVGCGSCGCAWEHPPPPRTVDSVDPPTHFAPDGFRIATLREIDAQGQTARIVRIEPEEDVCSFEDIPGFLGDGG